VHNEFGAKENRLDIAQEDLDAPAKRVSLNHR
jgi:hypothetical protein